MSFSNLIINDTINFKHRGTDSDLGVIRQVFENQDYRLDELARAGPILKCAREIIRQHQKPLVIDCGANIGASTIFFDMMFQGSHIVAVEPDVENYSLLNLNTKDFRNIKAVHAAVSAVNNSKLSVVDPGMGEWGYRTRLIDEKNDSEVQSVATVSIDSLMNEPESSPLILKIDVEGAEDDIFSANTDRFHEFPLIIIELHDWMLPRTANSRNFLQWHAEQDRDFVISGENIFSISNTLVS
jgi:FkbM family methyltransferase